MKTLNVAAMVLVLLSGCGKKETPETQVRRTVSEAAAAAEKKDSATLRATVSDKYTDTQGRDKKTVEGILRAYFLRNASLHLFTRTSSVTFPEKEKALATVYVGMAAQPVPSAEALERLRADLYRFDLTFVREGDAWRVVGAEWRPAELGDFVH
ncbi:MAG TPA: hypothetical protein VJS66_03695 [Burkholderiales bacterium]|nr:hypothetical protein [Burkholderiales bacterium]